MTWVGRVLSIIGPVIAYVVTYRLCLGLQHSDRAVLEHGIETGILKRLPSGEFIEVHQPLGPVDDHGHPVPLAYQGAPVPKRMNQLGSAGVAVPGCVRPVDDYRPHLLRRRAAPDGDRGRKPALAARFAADRTVRLTVGSTGCAPRADGGRERMSAGSAIGTSAADHRRSPVRVVHGRRAARLRPAMTAADGAVTPENWLRHIAAQGALPRSSSPSGSSRSWPTHSTA